MRAVILATFISLFATNAVFSSPFQTGTTDDIVNHIEVLVKKKTSDKTSMNALIQALQNPDSDIRVRERAAWALGALRISSAIPTLIEASHHKGLLIRSAALDALIMMRSRAALSSLIQVAESDPILSLRQRATLGLGLLQWEKTIPTLVKLSSDPTMEIQGAAALAMAATHSKKNDFSQVLKEMSKESDEHVKGRALKGLDIVSRKNTLVRAHLKSEDVDVRLFGALYFRQHGGSSDVAALREALNGEAQEDIRDELSKSLAAIKKRADETKKKKAEKAAAAAKPKN